jgi:hypothetical protein
MKFVVGADRAASPFNQSSPYVAAAVDPFVMPPCNLAKYHFFNQTR